MALILNINTAIDTASFCIAQDEKVIALEVNKTVKEQAAWLHNSIKISLQKQGLKLNELDAIAVSNGPGSYTGLRIGSATAKGICYAIKKPLISLNTLEIMASSVLENAEDYICPMIDARRMEVFTAIYNRNLETILGPTALILTESSFNEILAKYSVLFTGNGAEKFVRLIQGRNARFLSKSVTAEDMLSLSEKYFINQKFSNLIYSEPLYIKSVHL